MTSVRGRKYRSQRPVDVEAVFGIIKGNRNYRKFLLRGLEKVEIEARLLALAQSEQSSCKELTENPCFYLESDQNILQKHTELKIFRKLNRVGSE